MGKATGPANGNWKGGRTVTQDGYVLIRVGKDHPMADVRGYAYEHRLVAAEKTGRYLTSEEIAHHEDEIKNNNSPSNIEPLPNRSAHMRLHHPTARDRRRKGDPNPVIPCGCGCGHSFPKYDRSGRARVFITGHNMNVRRYGRYEDRVV
jgi:hypothetical protein